MPARKIDITLCHNMNRIVNFLNYIRLSLGRGMGVGFLMLMVSCESIDCTLNNVVTCNFAFYGAEGDAVAVNDTMTVTAEGTDSILLNRGTQIGSFSLPMSYWQDEDVLNFSFKSASSDYTLEMVLYLKKTNVQHFESPDCPTTMFHELEEVYFETNTPFVDSVVIVNKAVNYDALENVRIYLRTAD